MTKVAFVLGVVMLLVSCSGKDDTSLTSEVCYFPEGEAEKMHRELESSVINSSYNEKSKCIKYNPDDSELISNLDIKLFGETPPPGLNMSWGSRNDELVSLLSINDIPYKKYTRHGKDFYAWSYVDHARVVSALNISKERDEYMRTMQDPSFSTLSK